MRQSCHENACGENSCRNRRGRGNGTGSRPAARCLRGRRGHTGYRPCNGVEIWRTADGAIGIEADLSVENEVRQAVDRISKKFGRIDILVNNAGGAITKIDQSSAVNTSGEDRAVLFAANFETTVNMCQACSPHLMQRGGAIVNISTIGAFADDLEGRLAMYGAAKAAVEKYSKSLAVGLD